MKTIRYILSLCLIALTVWTCADDEKNAYDEGETDDEDSGDKNNVGHDKGPIQLLTEIMRTEDKNGEEDDAEQTGQWQSNLHRHPTRRNQT